MSDPAASVPFGFRDVEPEEKTRLVRGVFERVAGRYDLMNDLMSAGVHRAWKDMAVTRANPRPGELLIDVAGGTGDIARRWAARGAAAARRSGGAQPRAIICDINAEMLRAGMMRGDDDGIGWACGNAEALPFPDRAADTVTISFSIRNVTERLAALREMRRVLKPGGRFLCLEFSKPATRALEALYDAWSFHAIPRIGDLVVGDAESYRYLVESIRRFPDQNAFAAELEEAGFARVGYTNYSGGVAALHAGWRL